MRRLFAGFTLTGIALLATAQVGVPTQQQEGTPSVSTGSVPLSYTGGDSRASIGVDEHGNTQGELAGVFADNGDHAIVAQLWWHNGGAGGIQADYNWLLGTTLEQAKQDPDSISVAKLSFAVDQNAEKDRQANVGIAIERKEFFLNLYLAGRLSGARNAGAQVLQQQTTLAGSDDIGNFTQTEVETATTALQAQAYSYRVGMHGGHFSDALTARFNGGFDYSRGNQGAHESRFSLGADKYLGTRGWSVSAIAEHAQSNDPVSGSRSDDRFWFFVRYEFGAAGAFTPTSGETAWIQRALRTPVTGHPRDVRTYVTRGKTTTTTTRSPKQYTARRPLARDDSAEVAGNSSANLIDVLANDADPDGNPLSITAVGAAANGSAQVAGARVVYTPAPGFVGSDEFTYTVGNTKGLSATAQVHVTVIAGGAQPPVAQDDRAATAHATPVTIAVLANDSDPNGYPLSVASTTAPGHGTATINSDGTITYVPLAGFVGADEFSYTIGNGHGGSASARVFVTVQPPLPPLAQNDTATTQVATPVVIAVLANDSDPNGFALMVTSVTAPANGTAKINANGTLAYSPTGPFFGTDTFSYAISNGHGGSARATVTVTVLAPSGTLVARDDKATTPAATPVTINVLANDSAPGGLTLGVASVTQPAHGTALVNPNGSITYTPVPNFVGGTDVFAYTAGDGLETASATVTITVVPKAPPVAQPDTATTGFNKPVTVDVLANDSDPSGFALTVTTVSAPAHGSAAINVNGSVTYTPQTNYSGADVFNYTISNGVGGNASSSVAIAVQAPLPPIAVADSTTAVFQAPVTIPVLANDSDPNGLPLIVKSITAAPTHGSVQINGDNTVTYTPAAGYSGADGFTYAISDGFSSSAATVTINVQAPLAPVALNDSATIPFNPPAPVAIAVLGNDSDPGNFTLVVKQVTQAAHGTVTFDANGVSYLPGSAIPPYGTLPAPYAGSDSFTYTVSDGFNTATATVNVTVQLPTPVTAGSFTAQCVSDGSPCLICLSDNISNIEEISYSVTVQQPALAPTSSVTPPVTAGSCTDQVIYSIDTSVAESDFFTYTITDVYHAQPSLGTVTVTSSAP